MEKIGSIAGRGLARQESRSVSGNQSRSANALAAVRRSSSPPAVMNRMTDVELPRRLWEAWIEPGKPRLLRRALTTSERADLEARVAELEPWIVGFHAEEADHVALAVLGMLGSFRSMSGQTDEQVAATTDSLLRSLAEFPYWAIEKACSSVRVNGYTKENGACERHWAPSDSEMVHIVRWTTKLYRDQYDSAIALLNAGVAK